MFPLPTRLAIQKGQDGSFASTVGFSAYQYVFPRSGDVWLMVPELNFLPVVKQFIHTGELITNIVLEEQSAELFVPPLGDRIRHLTKPRGIIKKR
jgi:hypothetical protein